MLHRRQSKHFPVKKCFPDWVISSVHSSPSMTSQPQIFPMTLLWVPMVPWFTYQSHTYFPPLELGSSEAELTHLCGPDCPGKCAALMNALWRVDEEWCSFPASFLKERVSLCSPLCSQTQDLLGAGIIGWYHHTQLGYCPPTAPRTCSSFFNFWGHRNNALCWLTVGALGLRLTLCPFLLLLGNRSTMELDSTLCSSSSNAT